MVNEDIITALKNSIEHGESLQSSVSILVNSGYNPREVEEAARFIGGGSSINTEIKHEEQLTMPNQKILPPKQFKQTPPTPAGPSITAEQQIKPLPVQQNQALTAPLQNFQQSQQESPVTYSEPIFSDQDSSNLSGELQKMSSSPKQSYMKEIVLGLILLVLLIILGLTVVFRENIVGLFSG